MVTAEGVIEEAADVEGTAEGFAEEEVEEEAEEEVEMLEAEEGPALEEVVVDLSDGEVPVEEPTPTALMETPSAALAVTTSTAAAPAVPSPLFTPCRPGSIRIGSVSVLFWAPALPAYLCYF